MDDKFFQLEERLNKIDQRVEQLLLCTQSNAENIASLVIETRDIVRLHKDMQSIIRVSKNIQSFGLWILKWPLIGAGIYQLVKWISKNIS